MGESGALIVRRLGRLDYVPTWRAMQDFTLSRREDTPDECWLLEHPPVYTQGQAGRAEHLLRDIGIPVVPIDRGGQITYHGPGQLVVYLLVDLRRKPYKVREMVQRMEQAVIDLLADHGIAAERRSGAPGVYVGAAKVSALGLRVKNGCSYHGLALNIDMDLAPFAAINPCGYAGLAVTQLRDLGVTDDLSTVGDKLVAHLQAQLGASHG
ncbi:octanoyltransferase [Denitratisoma sp. DHT3]|uniref:lipoyl(octanoyl) transferase LipB n=1 Tax=Denitratisoma sp. DHT3 TaxID=1981880 RepID=UPI0011984242|nr:lipoyl(octanoyl) transferase LipB [Denitratisoma sp. DHT3]QDX81756.1 octanoyltransferase [Denitratisoma sp. DHT3]